MDEYLIEFSPVDFQLNETPEWIFFSSRNGVRFFINGLNDTSRLSGVHFACMGEGTAQELENLGHSSDYVGTGDPVQTAEGFVAMAENQKVLFPIAENSRRTVQEVLKSRINATSLVVYSNQIRTDFEIHSFDIVVCTSPMSVKAYFELSAGKDIPMFIAIGDSTSKAVRKMGVDNCVTAKAANEYSLIQTLKEQLHKS